MATEVVVRRGLLALARRLRLGFRALDVLARGDHRRVLRIKVVELHGVHELHELAVGRRLEAAFELGRYSVLSQRNRLELRRLDGAGEVPRWRAERAGERRHRYACGAALLRSARARGW